MSRVRTPPSGAVPILCRFWLEEEIWNGVALDLPVAVFGEDFEDAMANMQSALESHFSAIMAAGKLPELHEHLQKVARDYGFLAPAEISENSPIVKMLVAVQNQPQSAAAC